MKPKFHLFTESRVSYDTVQSSALITGNCIIIFAKTFYLQNVKIVTNC